jgi:hypothetical protein
MGPSGNDNIVLITVDALRADAGIGWRVSRSWNHFQRAFDFEWTFSTAPYTWASIASLPTGHHPRNAAASNGKLHNHC